MSNQTTISLEESEQLVAQVQSASRLLAGFYQRMLPMLDTIAKGVDAELDFDYWRPTETTMPSRGSSPPANRWAWDFLPLYAFNAVYKKSGGDSMELGDRILTLKLVTDTGFTNAKPKGYPNPVSLISGKSVLSAYIYKPVIATQTRLIDNYMQAEWAKQKGCWTDVKANMQAFLIEESLGAVIAKPSAFINEIKAAFVE